MNFLFQNITPKQTFLKNTFWLYFSNFILKLFKLFIVILSAKYLGPAGYGNFSYFLALVGFLFIFNDWGSGYLTIRDFQQEKDKENLINNFISFKLVLLTLFIFLSYLFLFYLKNPYEKSLFLLIFIFTFLQHFKNVYNAIFSALKKMEYEAWANLIESFVIFLLTFLFLKNFKDPLYLAFFYLIGICLSFFLSFFIFKKIFYQYHFHFRFTLDRFQYFLINGTPLMFLGFLSFIFFSTDQIILGYLRGYTEVGYYSLSTRIINNLYLIIAFLISALLPHLAEFKDDLIKMRRILNKITLYNFLIYIFICLLSILLAKPVFYFFFKETYLSSVDLFKFLIGNLLLVSHLVIFDNLLFIYNKQWLNFLLTAICASLNIFLNIILIPLYGMYGAGMATYLSQTLNLILTYVLVRKLILDRKTV
jgi:PST family polysaccharide transporter